MKIDSFYSLIILQLVVTKALISAGNNSQLFDQYIGNHKGKYIIVLWKKPPNFAKTHYKMANLHFWSNLLPLAQEICFLCSTTSPYCVQHNKLV